MVGQPERGTMTSPAVEPERTTEPVQPEPSRSPAAAPADPAALAAEVPAAAASAVAAREPLLPGQSREDTDAAWGDYPESAADRLYRDRPPHWADL
jgi:hypothetical protein